MFCLAKHLRKLFIVLLFLSAFYVSGQVFDNFSDENFTSDPVWYGDTSEFKITSSSAIPPELKPALQLDSEGSDTTILYLPNSLMENTEWSFWIKLSFNTSANNFARVYLVSDQADLENELNGYFVQVGGSNDSIALYRQSGLDMERIISSTIAFTGNSTNVLRIKVTKDLDNIWSLYSDGDGGYNFELEGTVSDNTFTSTSYFGIFCKYTSSNSTKFYFDDFYVNEIIIDTIPPEVVNLNVISESQLDVYFSEVVEINSAQDISNYFVNNNISNPENAIRDTENFALVHLDFQESFLSGIDYILSVSGVIDQAGNEMEPEMLNFNYEIPSAINPFDIVINEIMADVNPVPNNLPEADYLELYNRTEEVINLENCTVKPRESSDPIVFPLVAIEPDSFLIVVQTADVAEFEQYGAVVGLPGFSLNNEGTIVLRNQAGNLVNAISYTEEWYQDTEKENGGWSIEQIDPLHPCTGQQNWKASEDERGGTPGVRNSVDDLNFSFPEIISVYAVTENSVRVSFSHIMDSLSLINFSSYDVDQGIGNPVNMILNELTFNSIRLEFSGNFEENTTYQLTIVDSLFNCSGDYIELNSSYSFVLPLEAQPYEIVINEIMADPDPPIGLPEFEYIEIYNTTSSFLRMNGWILQVGSTDKQLPDIFIEPGEYIILTEEIAVNLFGMLARSFGFSSLGLTNSGTTLKLINGEGSVISSVAYRDNWYNDPDKEDGGWSLEQIDPANPCPGKDNWTACIVDIGGTPGGINSVYSENPVDPIVSKVIAINKTTLEVCFNQSMDEQTLIETSYYSVDNGIGNPVDVTIDGMDMNKVILVFENELEKRILYELMVSDDMKSCIGAPVPDDFSIQFGIAEPAVKGDVVINEVLFNPIDDGVDFVEIYNNSEKIIDVFDLYLGTVDVNQFEPNDTVYKSISDENRLVLTGDHFVLTKDQNKVKNQYYTENSNGFIEMASFPTYKNEDGIVIISGKNGELIDAFNYHEDMHHPILNSVDGVSLERINYNRPTQDITNWHSASKKVGFATPAYKNSQFSEFDEIEDPVTVEPEIFSPDNDGYNDILNIHYIFGSSGYTGNITIFDAQGRLVKYLVRNSLLGTDGTFSWDGRTEDNQKATIGIYIIYFEVFDINGNVKKYKKTAVVAGKL